jgi:hypothetical protein
MINKLISILLFSLVYSMSSFAGCTKFSSNGTCISDSTNGCHVEEDTVCQTSDTPDGCRRIGCTTSCPTRGYYVPYGNSTAWTAFKNNIPAAMSNSACLVATKSGSTTATTSSSGSTTTGCQPNATVCLSGAVLDPWGTPNCTTCCNPSGPPNVLCDGLSYGVCGNFEATCPLNAGFACGSCANY